MLSVLKLRTSRAGGNDSTGEKSQLIAKRHALYQKPLGSYIVSSEGVLNFVTCYGSKHHQGRALGTYKVKQVATSLLCLSIIMLNAYLHRI
jgi:hypothetical protein